MRWEIKWREAGGWKIDELKRKKMSRWTKSESEWSAVGKGDQPVIGWRHRWKFGKNGHPHNYEKWRLRHQILDIFLSFYTFHIYFRHTGSKVEDEVIRRTQNYDPSKTYWIGARCSSQGISHATRGFRWLIYSLERWDKTPDLAQGSSELRGFCLGLCGTLRGLLGVTRSSHHQPRDCIGSRITQCVFS